MADFQISTHHAKWMILTPQELVQKYKAANQRAIQALEKVNFKKFVTTSTFLIKFRLTCIYATCKMEENHVSAEELGKGISQDHQLILNNEKIVYHLQLYFFLVSYFSSTFFLFFSNGEDGSKA
ncbi:hypothetical protein F2P56_023748 [Juglans regia]|uniref:Uncharacterized protein n=1 Tax=Juglans regia TaxID=51240 RepID=A0A833UAX4_JUGRE|nr:hypothetical protein F2P56_023748 [Juglans regia]